MTFRIGLDASVAQRVSAFAMSCSFHAAWVGLVLLASPSPEPHKPTYTLTVLPPRAQERVIWYSRPDKLPPVSSGENAHHPLLLAERKQTITTSPDAPKGKEFIWVPDAPAQDQNPPDLPNMLVMAKTKPPLRRFEAPNPKRPAPPGLAVPLPPEVRAVPLAAAAKLPIGLASPGIAPKRPLRAFEEPRIRLPAAPDFQPPPELRTTRAAAGPGKLPLGLGGAAAPPSRPLRPFQPPPDRAGTSLAVSRVVEPPEPPALTAPVTDSSVSAAVVKLDGRQSGAVLPPVASHEARIAVGPAQPAQSEGKLSGTPGSIAISNLGVRGSSLGSIASHNKPASEPASSSVPPAVTGVVPRLPYQTTSSVSAPQWPGARTVPAVVEEQFRGRVVFKTVLTSTSSEDWVLWFGDREAVQPGTRFFMRPPVALQPAGELPRWVSPRSRVMLAGTLTIEGRLTDLTALVGPVTPELLDALGTSLFTPAMRNGKTVEVSVVIEFPGLD